MVFRCLRWLNTGNSQKHLHGRFVKERRIVPHELLRGLPRISGDETIDQGIKSVQGMSRRRSSRFATLGSRGDFLGWQLKAEVVGHTVQALPLFVQLASEIL